MSGKPLDLVLGEMGCAEPARSRMADFETLGAAWDKHSDPADLAWLAVRVAPDYAARAECATALLLLLNQQAALPPAVDAAGLVSPNPLAPVIVRMGQVAAAARDAAHAGLAERNAVLAVARQYIDDARVKLSAAERKREIARAARATYAGLRAVFLLELGGWPAKAAEEASTFIVGLTNDERAAIAKQLGTATIADSLRGLIDMKAFRSGWFMKSARLRT